MLETRHHGRREFRAEEDSLFSDESHVYLDDVPNRQNNRSWMEASQSFNHQRPLHLQKVSVWEPKIFSPYIFEQEDGIALTVNTARYVAML